MDYTIINRDTWETEKSILSTIFQQSPCTYSLTTKLDITNVREKGLKLYPVMLYCLTTVVNQHEPFRMALNDRNELILYAKMEPCYTVFHKDTKTFSKYLDELCK